MTNKFLIKEAFYLLCIRKYFFFTYLELPRTPTIINAMLISEPEYQGNNTSDWINIWDSRE